MFSKTLIATTATVAALTAPGMATPLEDIAFYTPVEDVVQHTRIDLDIKHMGEALEDDANFANYTEAKNIYLNGKNSFKSETEIRTLSSFSTGIAGKETALNEGRSEDDKFLQEYLLAKEYYGSETYAEEFVLDALNGEGQFAGLADVARIELAVKGVQYQVVWMYLLREVYEPLKACIDGSEPKIKNWDEGVAFYAGSHIGPKAEGSGFLQYTLAEKRCTSFGTCTGKARIEPVAEANRRAIEAFETGRDSVLNKDCDEIANSIAVLRKQMLIPLVQGSLLYAFRGDVKVTPATTVKEASEGWAFIAPLLPFINKSNPTEAAMLRKNMELNSNTTEYMADGFEEVFKAFYKTLPGMCISCEDIGVANFDAGDNTVPECVTDTAALEAGCEAFLITTKSGTDVGLMVGLLVGCAVLLVIVGAGMFVLLRSDKKDESNKVETEKIAEAEDDVVQA